MNKFDTINISKEQAIDMTNNVQTAAEWDRVIDNLELAKKSTLTQINGLTNQLNTLQSQRAELSTQLTRAQQGEDQEYIAAIRAEITKVDNQIAGNKIVTSNVMKEVSQYDQDLNYAVLQRAKANSGPPNDNSTTQPANANPGPNTSVSAPSLDPPAQLLEEIVLPNIPTVSIPQSPLNNVQTAAQWDQVIDNLELAKKSTLTQANGLREQLNTLESQRAELSTQLTRAQQGEDQEYIAVIRAAITKVDSQIAGNKIVTSNVMKEVSQYDQDLNYAFLQRATAKSGPPTAKSTTVPASANPGNPTNVDLTQGLPVLAEDGTLAISKRNPETGELYTPVVQNNVISNRQPEPVDVGATQAEADFINAEAQKQISDQEIAGLTTEAEAIQAAINQEAEANAELTREGRRGLLGELQNTREQAITQDTLNYNQLPDWRVRISLAQGADYLYKTQQPGILKPLQATNGVVFPYTPTIQMAYVSNYDAFDLIHSNYKIFQYKSSAVEQLSISADFTAQDATEAAYVLAVIHFFRTVTKMFYGKDQNPKPGTPPPLCYISGMGDFQFNRHPLVISNFSYTLPNDVDYIRAGAPTLPAGQSSSGYSTPNNSTNTSSSRMQANNVPVDGKNPPANWTTQTNIEPTYVPTKIQLSITALPIVTRKDVSDNFSVKEYATGALMRGRQNSRGGIW